MQNKNFYITLDERRVKELLHKEKLANKIISLVKGLKIKKQYTNEFDLAP